MAREGLHQVAVGRVPQFDEIIVAATGDARSVGADGQAAQPAGVRLDRARRRRRIGRGRPEDQSPLVPACVQRLPIGREGQRADPAFMPGERNVRAACDFPSLHGTVLCAGKGETPRRIEAARDERARVLPLDGDVGLRGIGFGGLRGVAHTSSSLMALAAGSAIGIGRPPTSKVSDGSRPTAVR